MRHSSDGTFLHGTVRHSSDKTFQHGTVRHSSDGTFLHGSVDVKTLTQLKTNNCMFVLITKNREE